MEFPEKILPVAHHHAASPEKFGVGCKGKSTLGNTRYAPDCSSSVEGVGGKEESTPSAPRREASGASVGSDERGDKKVPVRLGAQREEHHRVGWRCGSKTEPARPRTLPPSRDCRQLRLLDHSVSARVSRKEGIGGVGRTTPCDLLSSSPIHVLSCGSRPRSAVDLTMYGRRRVIGGGNLVIGMQSWPLCNEGGDYRSGSISGERRFDDKIVTAQPNPLLPSVLPRL
ncbi:unnamed protein product [Ectocarpus sp. 12 AP-2014]